MRKIISALALLGASFSGALAQEAQNQGAYGDWVVLTRETENGRVCFAVSEPQESTPSNVDHGSVFFVISSWANGLRRCCAVHTTIGLKYTDEA